MSSSLSQPASTPSPEDVLQELQVIDLLYEQADLRYQFTMAQAECEKQRAYTAIKKREAALYTHQARVLKELEEKEE